MVPLQTPAGGSLCVRRATSTCVAAATNGGKRCYRPRRGIRLSLQATQQRQEQQELEQAMRQMEQVVVQLETATIARYTKGTHHCAWAPDRYSKDVQDVHKVTPPHQ